MGRFEPCRTLLETCADAVSAWLGVDRLARLTPVSGAPRGALLVRPDAHLAWRGTDPAAVRRWLTGALHRADPTRPLASAG